MTDVYFTWFGPPAAANKAVTNEDTPVRPDIFGITRIGFSAFSTYPQPPQPSLKFCCLKEHATRFRADLPDYVTVLPIEDQFSTKDYHAISLSRPDLTNLDMSVDYIIRETIKFRGSRGLPVRRLAFMKDIWSLFVLWKFGGYHLDCGCFPGPEGRVNLPDPGTFGIVSFAEQPNSPYLHQKIAFPDKMGFCSAISVGNRVFGGLVLEGMTSTAGACKLNRMIDVWAMRSPAGNKAIQIALQFYILGWFAIQAKESELGSENLIGDAYRELIVSAAATGVTHSGHDPGCLGLTLWKSHLIDATMSPAFVPSLNIGKVGFQSHRG